MPERRSTPPERDVRRAAGWLPDQPADLEDWLHRHGEQVRARGPQPLHPAVAALRDEVEADPVLRMYVTRMIDQVPEGRTYTRRHLTEPAQLYALMSAVLRVAPEYGGDTMVMLPMSAVLDWAMATPAGYSAFRDDRVNRRIKDVLDAWREFLDGPDSRYVLRDGNGGWMSRPARDAVHIDLFAHDPEAEYWGFTSWNDFFARRLAPSARPTAAPDDDSVVVNACESTPFRLDTDVARQSKFWLKGQPYSLLDLLGPDVDVDRFVGGTVYQAFLSAIDYHRWHSPVSGTVVSATVLPGTYYSENDNVGSDADGAPDSQSYLAHVAARAVVVIEADNPEIGRVAFVPIGMLEVSSCVLDPGVTPGAHVGKGDELGYFQYGGSTHCLVFEPGAVLEFALAAVPQPLRADQHDPVPVRSALATARARRPRSGLVSGA